MDEEEIKSVTEEWAEEKRKMEAEKVRILKLCKNYKL